MAGLSGLFWLAMNKQSAQDRLDITLVHLSTPHELGRGVWWSESAVSLRTTRTPSVNKQDSSFNQRGLFPASASPPKPLLPELCSTLLSKMPTPFHCSITQRNGGIWGKREREWERGMGREREWEMGREWDEEREGVGEGDGERGSGRERERT